MFLDILFLNLEIVFDFFFEKVVLIDAEVIEVQWEKICAVLVLNQFVNEFNQIFLVDGLNARDVQVSAPPQTESFDEHQ